MRVLVVAEAGLGDKSGYSIRVASCCSLLLQMGHSVHLGLIQPLNRWFKKSVQVQESSSCINFKQSVLFIPFKSLFWPIALANRICFLLQSLLVFYIFKPDIVHSHSVYSQFLASQLCRKFQCKNIYDYHGAYAFEKAYSAHLPISSSTFKSWNRVELANVKSADAVITVSNAAYRHLVTYYQLSLQKKSALVPCFVNRPSLDYCSSRDKIRDKLGIANRKVIMYVGNAHPWQMPQTMINFFSCVKARFDSAFLIIMSSEPDRFRNLVKDARMQESDYFLGTCSYSELPAWTAGADLGLLLREDHVLNNVAFPTKFLDYLCAGVPVCTTHAVYDIVELIQAHELGMLIDTSSLETQADQLIEFLQTFDYQSFRFRALDVADSYNSSAMLGRYKALYSSIA